MWIGFCVVGGAAHAAIFMVRDYTPANNYNNLLDRVLRHRDSIIAHLNWVCIFLGMHSFGFTFIMIQCELLGRPQDMFSDNNSITTYFCTMDSKYSFISSWNNCSKCFSNNKLCVWWRSCRVGGKIAMMPIQLGTADFMVHHIHAFTIHVTVLILLRCVICS
jgi:photosystem I P700 chlorophyll a apoprotein A1